MRLFSFGLFALGVLFVGLSWGDLSAGQRNGAAGVVLCLAAVLVQVADLRVAGRDHAPDPAGDQAGDG